jgi:transcription antitermination protein NusB
MTPSSEPSSESAKEPARLATAGARRGARLAAVQALYQIEMMGGDLESVILEFVAERRGVTLEGDQVLAMDSDFFSDLVRGASRRRRELDRIIVTGLAEGWRLERLEAVLRAILRIAAYELSVRVDVPVKVAINEYVEVAHAYLPAEQSRFVNAILDRIAHQLRADEFGGDDHGRPAEAR